MSVLRKIFRLIIARLRLRFYGVKRVDITCYLATSSQISHDLVMGPYGYIGPNAEIPCMVYMGKYVMIGKELLITGNDHKFNLSGTPMIFSGRPSPKVTVIEDDVWIGSRVIIMTGVIIGRGSIIGAGSVVTKNIEPYSVVAGVPARLIRSRFTPEQINEHEKFLRARPVAGSFCESIF